MEVRRVIRARTDRRSNAGASRTLRLEALKGLLSHSDAGIRDTALGLVPQVASALSGLLTAILAARGLGARHLGTYSLAATVTATIAGLSDLGIGQTAIRFAAQASTGTAKHAQFAILRWAFRLRFAASLLLAALFWFGAEWIGTSLWRSSELAHLIRLATIPGVLNTVSASAGYFYQSERRFKASSALATVQTLAILVAVSSLAVVGRWSPTALMWCTVLSAALTAGIAISAVPTAAFFVTSERFTLNPFARFLRAGERAIEAPRGFAALMALAASIVVLTGRLDVWLLGTLLTPESVGIYTVATRFALPLTMFVGALNAALWPRAAHLSGDTALAFLRRTLLLSGLAALAAVAYSLAAPMLTSLLFGRAYASAMPVAVLLCIRYVFAIAITPVGIVGYSFGLVRWYWVSNLLQLLVVASLVLLLVPAMGPLGAAVALCANELVGGAVVFLLLRRASARMQGVLVAGR